VEIVENEHERPRLRKLLEQRAHGAMTAITLVLQGYGSSAAER
jgi:hypothetical protein